MIWAIHLQAVVAMRSCPADAKRYSTHILAGEANVNQCLLCVEVGSRLSKLSAVGIVLGIGAFLHPFETSGPVRTSYTIAVGAFQDLCGMGLGFVEADAC